MISVIIPHLNDAGLPACLAALNAQTFQGDFEILVVDNGSVEPPVEICAPFSRVLLLYASEPGPGPARNRGVKAARGDVLAFTDADCEPAPDWLQQIALAMEDRALTIAGGRLDVRYNTPEQPSFTEPYERVFSFRNKMHIAEGYSASANMAVRRDVFDAVGGFKGREFAEDLEWGKRASSLGYAPQYRDTMIVHNAPRADLAALKQKWARHIGHDYAARTSKLAWVLKAMSLPFSPLFEIPEILRTDQLHGARERLLCFACLCVIRSFRARRMLSRDPSEFAWNPGKPSSSPDA